MILLTDEEIVYLNVGRKPTEEELKRGVGKVYPSTVRIARAQLKKVVELGSQPCDIEGHSSKRFKGQRWSCYGCWQALKKEIE